MMLILQHSAELFAGMRCRRFPALLPELPVALGCDADTPKQMAAPALCKQPAVAKRKKQHGDAESHAGGVSITPQAMPRSGSHS